MYDGVAQPQPTAYTSISATIPGVVAQTMTSESGARRGDKPVGHETVPANRPPCAKKSVTDRSARIRSVKVVSPKRVSVDRAGLEARIAPLDTSSHEPTRTENVPGGSFFMPEVHVGLESGLFTVDFRQQDPTRGGRVTYV